MTSAEEFTCLFCKDSFETKEELQIHFRKHGDPKFNQSVKGKSLMEMAASGDKSEEGEVVNCDVCDEVFPTISKAITHKHKAHPDHDAKYFCPWCGKLFTMKHLYNKHIQSTHDTQEEGGQTGFHCDYCEVDFFVPSAMLYHNKFFHRQDTELAAIGHSKKLTVFNQESLQIYYCPFCGEEYCNKVNLHKHMGDDHIDENQSPEDVLRCSLCEAVFYHLDAYELHLTFHSPDDKYSEENELFKQITEFSLETVPPIMEKVDNESQEDEPAESMGIEELLQQGMNESNDNDAIDGLRKKKKHKKHKKSKKTITLDEFLNMNSEVFGEGFEVGDVQGIAEVPTHVIAKTLRKPLTQKRKPGPKPLPSAELDKLKKAGIVVKKKQTPLQGMKIPKKAPVLGNIPVGTKVKSSTEQTSSKSSSNEILTKLLNQSNSQIKIIKKPAENTEVLSSIKEPSSSKELKNIVETTEENRENGDVRNIAAIENSKTEKKLQGHVENDNKDSLSHDSLLESDNQCSTKDTASDNEITEDTNTRATYETEIEKEKRKESTETESISKEDVTNSHNVTPMDVLRNISQHITIKSVSSPKSRDIEPKHSPLKEDNEKSDTEAIHSEDNHEDSIENEKSPENTNKSPFHALKHLSHLTVKSANQLQTSSPTPTLSKKDFYDPKPTNSNNIVKKQIIGPESDEAEDSIIKDTKDAKGAPSTLDALKTLGKHITIKPTSQSLNSTKNVVETLNHNESDIDEENVPDNNKIQIRNQVANGQNNTTPNRQVVMKTGINLNSPKAKLPSPQQSPKIQNNPVENEIQNKNNEVAVYNANIQSNENILKKLSNITAKPINFAKNVSQKVTVQSSTQSVQSVKGNLIQDIVKKVETKQEDIEIFNIDDSDDEDTAASAPTPQMPLNQSNCTPGQSCNNRIENKNSQEKSMDMLKNLSKHITIKPKNLPNTVEKKIVDSDDVQEDNFHSDETNSDKNEEEPEDKLDNQIETILQNKLKSLSNITMKSNNTSPRNTVASFNSPKTKKSSQVDDDESDLETSRVKITELPDDFPSDEEDIPLQKMKNAKYNTNSYVHEDVGSEPEAHVEDNEDIESQIKRTTLKKLPPNTSKTPACLNNLKNLTVKSLKDNKTDQTDEDILEKIPKDNSVANQNKQLTVKPFKPSTPEDDSQEVIDKVINRPPSGPRQQVRRATLSNTATSSNTVNKEVTVQKFQTKTVIQEITTTVTKTIRTVNQSVKQEVQNMNQKTLMIPTRPQKLLGVRPNVLNKHNQGMSVRPAAPTMGPRLRHPVVPTRPPVGANVRPSNQIVTVRPGLNVARLSNPRMPGVRKPTPTPTPSTSNQKRPVLGKPLKISPNVMMPPVKRSSSNESGPFSCFKKPKESLIPESDDLDFAGDDDDGDSAVQYSSSHMSQSNFTSTIKMVKGNSLVTSSQMKSEASASSEQLSRLNSMSGLKVVKTSQVKQTSKVEETEVNPAKRSALSAIERLQKQGLLVKKPRSGEPVIEEPESDHSNPDADDDYYDDT